MEINYNVVKDEYKSIIGKDDFSDESSPLTTSFNFTFTFVPIGKNRSTLDPNFIKPRVMRNINKV